MSDDRFCFVHGMNSRRAGRDSIDRLGPYVNGEVDTDGCDYGWIGLLGVRLKKRKITERLSRAFEKADYIVTHSNGAPYSREALWNTPLKPKSVTVINFSPAMDRDVTYPRSVKAVHTFHTMGDFWVRLSRWLPFHHFGDAGARGLIDSPYTQTYNHDYTHRVDSHSGWFDDQHVKFFAECVNSIAEGSGPS